MEKNDAQINRVAVVKRAPSPLKKCFRKKNPFSLFVQIGPTKLCAEVFLKQTSLEIFNFRWFFSSEKLAFNIKLLMKLDRQRIKKNSAHRFRDNYYLTNHLVKFLEDRIKPWWDGALRVCTGYHFLQWQSLVTAFQPPITSRVVYLNRRC